jgi:hypothetical protein
MKILLLNLLIVIVCGLLYSCASSSQVFSDYDRSIDFTNYKSYAWLEKADSSKGFFDNQIVEKNFRFYVDREMSARGYRLDPENPDLLLDTRISTQKKSYTTSTPVYSNPGYDNTPYYYNGRWYYRSRYISPAIIGYNYDQVEYNEGTLQVDMIDRKINQLVWRGISVGSLNDIESFEADLPENIRKIFLKYPVPSQQMVKTKKRLEKDDQY